MLSIKYKIEHNDRRFIIGCKYEFIIIDKMIKKLYLVNKI